MAEMWERWKGESAKAYEAFSLYRDMGPTRSLAKVGQRLGKSTALMEDWSAKWHWVKRVEDYEAHRENERLLQEQALLEQARLARAKELEDLNRRHAQQAQLALQALMQPITVFLRKTQGDRDWAAKLEELSPAQLLSLIQGSSRFMPSIAQMERLARGVPTTIQKAEVQTSPASAAPAVTTTNEPPNDLDRISAVLSILTQAGVLSTGTDAGSEDQAN